MSNDKVVLRSDNPFEYHARSDRVEREREAKRERNLAQPYTQSYDSRKAIERMYERHYAEMNRWVEYG